MMDQYGMMDHIRDHSVMVEKAARVIARGLAESGIDLSMDKVTAGALMHDIAKTECIRTGEDHAALGRTICIANRFHEISDIVGEHVRLKGFRPNGTVSEKEIVYYADKRVNHDTVVSLEERLAYLIERYGRNDEDLIQRIQDNFQLCRDVEKKLFARLDFGPDDLARAVVRTRCHEVPKQTKG
jgi:putative nucleotidyltransferase with HDIG domain